ncbi:MAG: hypothetical protein L0338_39620 [Acidobacteria bacterium]|nr:hypothetical protein [Acidobacteriota bacterium]
MADENYVTIREVLGDLIGQKVIDITQHDEEDWDPEIGIGFVYLQFDSGDCLRFALTCENCGFELLVADYAKE